MSIDQKKSYAAMDEHMRGKKLEQTEPKLPLERHKFKSQIIGKGGKITIGFFLQV